MDAALLQIVLITLSGATLLNSLLLVTLVKRINAVNSLFYQRPELIVGKGAPPFEARTLSGEKASLNTYSGKNVVFIFFTPDCGWCRREIPGLEKIAAAAKKNYGIELIMVSESDDLETRQIVEEFGISMPVLIAPRQEYEFAREYNPLGMHPYYCFVNSEGLIQSRDLLNRQEWLQMSQKWLSSSIQDVKESRARYR